MRVSGFENRERNLFAHPLTLRNMKPQSFRFYHCIFSPSLVLPILLFMTLVGCSRSLHWVHEMENGPSCIPDRLPTWEDYTPQERQGKASAVTAVLFASKSVPPKIEMQFDYQRSWVKESIVDPWNPELVGESQRILMHEQLHFMISCLLTRQANQTLQNGGNPHEMVQQVKTAANQLNLQYDKDTNHGLNTEAQLDWEREIQQQLLKLSIKQARGF